MPTEPEDAMCECGEPIKPGDLVYLSVDIGFRRGRTHFALPQEAHHRPDRHLVERDRSRPAPTRTRRR